MTPWKMAKEEKKGRVRKRKTEVKIMRGWMKARMRK